MNKFVSKRTYELFRMSYFHMSYFVVPFQCVFGTNRYFSMCIWNKQTLFSVFLVQTDTFQCVFGTNILFSVCIPMEPFDHIKPVLWNSAKKVLSVLFLLNRLYYSWGPIGVFGINRPRWFECPGRVGRALDSDFYPKRVFTWLNANLSAFN